MGMKSLREYITRSFFKNRILYNREAFGDFLRLNCYFYNHNSLHLNPKIMSDRTITLDDQLYNYLTSVSLREPQILRQLRTHNAEYPQGHMQVSPEQGQFMGLLLKLMGAKRVLEVGVFTGYSSLSMALALPLDGSIVACDISLEATDVARRYWQEAGVISKIDLRIAPALETLDSLIQQGHSNSFDLAFIDADKGNYPNYYERCLQLVRPGGIVAVDNVLWYGRVADPQVTDSRTNIIRQLNQQIHQDDRVEMSLLPIGDGLTLARKK
jgi:predicted O-methyltransferase YrrM